MRRIMIAGTGSGSGKTTVTCAILSALRQSGIHAASFKCGPDYIDPMFHREVLGTPSCNLDGYFCDRNTLCYLLDRHSKSADIAVIECVMGFYDGDSGSAYNLSEQTETPVIIVVDCKGMQASIGAVMLGFLQYQTPNRIAGFIFNRLPERLIPYVKQLCGDLNTTCFGSLPRLKDEIPSRHLGLVTAAEILDLQDKMQILGGEALKSIDIGKIIQISEHPLPRYTPPEIPKCDATPVIAVAKDSAFCFHYAENLDLLGQMGCKLQHFSPLHDAHLPEADGLILCGGYPELYAKELSENRTMLHDIRQAIRSGMPVIAECGGFMYLHTELKTKSGDALPMADIITGCAFPTDSLRRFGYITMEARNDQLLCSAGHKIRAHEFHYWDSTACGDSFHAVKPDDRSWDCIHGTDTMYAGFPHLYFYADIPAAYRFVQAAARYGAKHGTNQSDQTA